jgi:KDO2-lipid IV(A) lauroyltransferase
MFKIIVWLLSRIPLRLGWWFSWVLAWLWWTVAPIRKRTAVDGFRHVFPDLPVGPNLRREAAGLVMGYIELFHEARKPCIELAIENSRPIHEHIDAGEGVILVAGHFGSWDLVGPMVGRDESLPATVVVKNPSWKPAAEFVDDVRRKFGLGLLPSKNTFNAIMEELAAGRTLVFLLDQRYRKGIPIEFFGRPAWTSPAVAVAIHRSGAPVYGLSYWRNGVGRHGAKFTGPLPMVGDIEADTRTIQEFYEEVIRERPHSWLWLHDRWREP